MFPGVFVFHVFLILFPVIRPLICRAALMKRAANGKVVANKKAEEENKDLFGRPMASLGSWEQPDEDLIAFIPHDVEHRELVAAFDMDGTLITTKSGKVFPKDTFDWMFWDETVVPKLRELYEKENYKLLIFTNQAGIRLHKVDVKAFKQKIEAIVKKAGVPIQVYISPGDGRFRKPMTGMWDHFVKCGNGDVKVDKERSVFVGDAAGRHKTRSHEKKDHSCADRFFALNIGLPFKTPEQFFLNKKADQPWGPIPFCPKAHAEKNHALLEPKDAPLPAADQEIIVMVGFPGSGKSTFAKMLADKYGYTVVNRDTVGTWQKCVAIAREAIREKKSVVVDNTNPDKETRRRYVVLAKEMGDIPVRCFEMVANYDHAVHNVKYRSLTKGGPKISSMVLRMHKSKFQEPELNEGFSSIVRVNFVPDFDSEEDKQVYHQYLVE